VLQSHFLVKAKFQSLLLLILTILSLQAVVQVRVRVQTMAAAAAAVECCVRLLLKVVLQVPQVLP
jgi:hypothetical protein